MNLWRKLLSIHILLVAALPGDPGVAAELVTVTWPGAERSAVREALPRELADALGRLYPGDRFVSGAGRKEPVGKRIYLGTPRNLTGVAGAERAATRLKGPESFVVAAVESGGGGTVGMILGADERGVVHGVYSLLRKLGCGYTLDGDLVPAPRTGGFTFDGWDMADHPLVPRRFVFNWHNFLSGCSSWNPGHWRRWIAQSQKMGYNGIMLHAYGNNPMTGFSFRGVDKPVGNLSSTRIGRDWATMHVNDVRRLIGGEVFDAPVLGSAAAVAGTDRERTEAAQEMMGEVFGFAGERGVDVILAVDMDTDSANPQALIMQLPEHARYAARPGGGFWLPRPDVPEGYAYYRAQLAHLLDVYPQLDSFVLWFRKGGTPMMRLKLEDLPAEWRGEFEAIVATEPKVAEYWNRVGIFVLGKVAAAHRKALRELGREEVTLGLGSWGFDLQSAADRFLPDGVALYPLDYEVQWKESRLESPGGPEGVAKVAAHRPVYPIHWANHDDCTYVGPSYPPFEGFHTLLERSECDGSGFGVLHWTTRPLDLFFMGLSDAVWESSKNQSVRETCRRMARAMLGAGHEEVFGEYLHQWLQDLPMIGRDTSDFFIDRELMGHDEALKSHRERMQLLDALDKADLTPGQHERAAYFRGLERFVLGIFENEALYRNALTMQQEGDPALARRTLAGTDVPAVIRHFVDTAKLLGITRGEEGLIVSLNLRWLTHYLCLAQQLGAEPVRINFAPTVHEHLAQNRGKFTYFIDRDDRAWEVRGEEETKVPAYGNPAGWVESSGDGKSPWWEVGRSGIESDRSMDLRISPMMNRKGQVLAPGRYKLTLIFGVGAGKEANEKACDVALHLPGHELAVRDRVVFDGPLDADSPVVRSYDVEWTEPGIPRVVVTPVDCRIRISGLVLKPVTGR